MGLVLRDLTREEDLELVTYWVDRRGKCWQTNSDNIPLCSDCSLFDIGDKGIIAPIEGEEVPVRLRFWLKMLRGSESNAIANAMSSPTASISLKGESEGKGEFEMKLNIDLVLVAKLWLGAGLIKWDGILGEDGEPASVSDKYIDLLPAWLYDDLVDRIKALNTHFEEE